MSEVTPSGGSSGLTHLFELARGGIGTVELAVRREGTFERVYALKRLHKHLRSDESFCSMFVEEARIAGRLRHANIAGVLDVGTDDEGPYFVMEYVEGLSLRDLLKTSAVNNLLPVQLVLRIIEQTAGGLHAAHEATSESGELLNLVHRDVSPHNILVGYDGVVRVADFGIAKVRDSENRTSTGILKGKMGYMSPEQLRFEPADRRSDIFSLGVTMYEALSARRLYGSSKEIPTEAAYRILHEDPPEIGTERRDVPPELEALLLEMLAKTPDERPATALEVSERIGAMLHALATDEEPIRIAEYLDDHFKTRKAATADRVRAAIVESRVSAPARTASSRRWLLLGAAAMIGAAAIIVAVSEPTPSVTDVEMREVATEERPSGPAAGAPVSVATPDRPVDLGADLGVESTAGSDAADPTEAAAPEMSPRRRRGRRPRTESMERLTETMERAPESSMVPATMERSDGWWPRM